MEKSVENPFSDGNIDLESLYENLSSLSPNSVDELKKLTALQSEMAEDLIDRFLCNIEAFRKYLPEISQTFEHYKPKRSMEFFCMENKIPNLIFLDNNDIFYKTADPFKLCRRQVDRVISQKNILQLRYPIDKDPYGQIHFKYCNKLASLDESYQRDRTITPKEIESIPNCIMIGVGLGYPLADLYNQVEIANMIIVEPDLDIFFASLHAFDWAPLLDYIFSNNYGLHIMLGQNAEQLYGDLESFYVHHGRFLAGTWLGYIHYNTSKTQEMVKLFEKHYKAIYSAMGFFDDHLFGTSHACASILKHKKFVLRDKMKDCYKNVPVFVIGSGPSLDNDIDFIRKNQDKAIIIACGTALDVLYHAGIKPDFYANTERTPQIRQTLNTIPDKDFFRDIILMTGDVCHPRTVEMFEHTAIFGKPDEPFYPYFAMGFPQDAGKIQYVQLMNPLVGNMGVSGAVYMGFNKLYLFGIDNGKKLKSGNLHSSFSTLYNQYQVKTDGFAYKTTKIIPGNFGGECQSGHFYELSARNIGFVLTQEGIRNKDLVCYNCSDGAKIDRAIPKHSEELKADFEKLPELNKKEFFRYMTEEKTFELKITREDIKRALSPDVFKITCEKIKQILLMKSESRPEFVKKLETCSEIIYTMKANPHTYYYADVLEGSLQTFFAITTRVLYTSRELEVCLNLANQAVDIIIDFLTEAPTLFAYLPDYVLEDHRKYYKDGLVGVDMPHCKATRLPDIDYIINSSFDDPLKKFVKRYE